MTQASSKERDALRMKRGWEGSSRALQRRIESAAPAPHHRFYRLEHKIYGRWVGNGCISGRTLVEAWGKAQRDAKAYKWANPIRLTFDHYGCRAN